MPSRSCRCAGTQMPPYSSTPMIASASSISLYTRVKPTGTDVVSQPRRDASRPMQAEQVSVVTTRPCAPWPMTRLPRTMGMSTRAGSSRPLSSTTDARSASPSSSRPRSAWWATTACSQESAQGSRGSGWIPPEVLARLDVDLDDLAAQVGEDLGEVSRPGAVHGVDDDPGPRGGDGFAVDPAASDERYSSMRSSSSKAPRAAVGVSETLCSTSSRKSCGTGPPSEPRTTRPPYSHERSLAVRTSAPTAPSSRAQVHATAGVGHGRSETLTTRPYDASTPAARRAWSCAAWRVSKPT